MPKFESREEYEKWKAEKMKSVPEAPETPARPIDDLPPHLMPPEEEADKGSGSFAKWIVLAVFVARIGEFLDPP